MSGHEVMEETLPLKYLSAKLTRNLETGFLKSILINSKHALSLGGGNKRTICTLCS